MTRQAKCFHVVAARLVVHPTTQKETANGTPDALLHRLLTTAHQMGDHNSPADSSIRQWCESVVGSRTKHPSRAAHGPTLPDPLHFFTFKSLSPRNEPNYLIHDIRR